MEIDEIHENDLEMADVKESLPKRKFGDMDGPLQKAKEWQHEQQRKIKIIRQEKGWNWTDAKQALMKLVYFDYLFRIESAVDNLMESFSRMTVA